MRAATRAWLAAGGAVVQRSTSGGCAYPRHSCPRQHQPQPGQPVCAPRAARAALHRPCPDAPCSVWACHSSRWHWQRAESAMRRVYWCCRQQPCRRVRTCVCGGKWPHATQCAVASHSVATQPGCPANSSASCGAGPSAHGAVTVSVRADSPWEELAAVSRSFAQRAAHQPGQPAHLCGWCWPGCLQTRRCWQSGAVAPTGAAGAAPGRGRSRHCPGCCCALHRVGPSALSCPQLCFPSSSSVCVDAGDSTASVSELLQRGLCALAALHQWSHSWV